MAGFWKSTYQCARAWALETAANDDERLGMGAVAFSRAIHYAIPFGKRPHTLDNFAPVTTLLLYGEHPRLPKGVALHS